MFDHRRHESKAEKRFNYILVFVSKVAALILAVLAAAGFAVSALSIESVVGMLAASLVILTLASLQDSMAIHRYCREHDEHDEPHKHDKQR